MLEKPYTKEEMIEILKKDAIDFVAKDVIMAFVWFFRATSACDGVEPFSMRLAKSQTAISSIYFYFSIYYYHSIQHMTLLFLLLFF